MEDTAEFHAAPAEVKLHISDPEKRKLTIGEVGKALKSFEDIIYHIAEYRQLGYRSSGKRNPSLMARTALYFREVHTGSFEAVISSEPQATFGKPIVEEALEDFTEIVHIIEEDNEETVEEEIKKKISSDSVRARLMKSLNNIWPGGDNEYSLDIEFKRRELFFDPKKKKVVKKLSEIEGKEHERTMFGVVSEIRYTAGKKKFELLTPRGKIVCEYDRVFKDRVHQFADQVVTVHGVCEIDNEGMEKKVKNLLKIEPIRNIPIQHIVTEDSEIHLREPIDVGVSYEEDMWHLEYEPLSIYAAGDSFNDAIDNFNSDFVFLYKRYALGNPDKFGKTAKKLRKLLLEYVGDRE